MIIHWTKGCVVNDNETGPKTYQQCPKKLQKDLVYLLTAFDCVHKSTLKSRNIYHCTFFPIKFGSFLLHFSGYRGASLPKCEKLTNGLTMDAKWLQ